MGSILESWAPRDEDVLQTCWERKWLSLVDVASIKRGVTEDVKETESVFRGLNFCSGNPIRWTINYLLFPFRSLPLSQKNFWQNVGGSLHSSNHICSGGRRFWVGLFICPWPSRSWVYPNQSKRLVPMAGPSDVSKTFSQLTLPVLASKLVMCWNVSSGCWQFVLGNAWKLFSHFHNQCKNQAWPARTFLWPWFWFFQAGAPLCFDEIVRRSGFRKKNLCFLKDI